MMIRDKIIRCACPALLIVFSGLLGFADKTEAQPPFSGLIKDISIEDIFADTEVIDNLKKNEEVKTKKRDIRDSIREKKVKGVRNFDDRTAAQALFMAIVEDKVGLNGIKKDLFMKYSGPEIQKLKFSDPSDPNGLAVRIAPSDDELFKISP